jgi:hypothetical protein
MSHLPVNRKHHARLYQAVITVEDRLIFQVAQSLFAVYNMQEHHGPGKGVGQGRTGVLQELLCQGWCWCY